MIASINWYDIMAVYHTGDIGHLYRLATNDRDHIPVHALYVKLVNYQCTSFHYSLLL